MQIRYLNYLYAYLVIWVMLRSIEVYLTLQMLSIPITQKII